MRVPIFEGAHFILPFFGGCLFFERCGMSSCTCLKAWEVVKRCVGIWEAPGGHLGPKLNALAGRGRFLYAQADRPPWPT